MSIFSRQSNKESSINAKTEAIQEQLAEKMMGFFDSVIEDRSKYYAEHQDKIPNQDSIKAIIQTYASKNALISGGAGLVPGPLGMLAAVPEIGFVIRNQIEMIYDIGTAYGKKQVLTKELLAGVFSTAIGSGALGLLTVQGSKVLVKRASLRFLQKAVQLLAGKVTQRMLRSMVSKYVPVAGAAAMAAWSNLSTRTIGKQATIIFEKEITISSEDPEEFLETEASKLQDTSQIIEDAEQSLEEKLDILKIQSLINLMMIDGQIESEEQEYIGLIVEGAEINDHIKMDLIEAITGKTKFKIDYSEFTNSPDEKISLLVDMVALAKRDGEFHIAEKLLIKQVGKIFDFSTDEIEEVMAS
ncbi:TerB family tellurite resistance protein [Sphaerothrix gracilis]|uniref:TerB family tellurite resistance protein n=1 Tax=Sphaerothrix gracilis TaxID=3151835 RepID=UPI0031FD28F2